MVLIYERIFGRCSPFHVRTLFGLRRLPGLKIAKRSMAAGEREDLMLFSY